MWVAGKSNTRGWLKGKPAKGLHRQFRGMSASGKSEFMVLGIGILRPVGRGKGRDCSARVAVAPQPHGPSETYGCGFSVATLSGREGFIHSRYGDNNNSEILPSGLERCVSFCKCTHAPRTRGESESNTTEAEQMRHLVSIRCLYL